MVVDESLSIFLGRRVNAKAKVSRRLTTAAYASPRLEQSAQPHVCATLRQEKIPESVLSARIQREWRLGLEHLRVFSSVVYGCEPKLTDFPCQSMLSTLR